MKHHSNCNVNYPEKPQDELPQHITHETIDNIYFVDTCSDCGAFETNLPSENDPYWDNVKETLK